MRHSRLQSLLAKGVVLLCCAAGWGACAGGSGLNVAVVVNQASSNSCELGNYFCERRGVPPENVLRIQWPGANTSWNAAEFQAVLLTPLLDMLANRRLTNQVDYVVLSMDIPFQTVNGGTVNGTTSALFYGLRSSSGDAGVTNSYAASEAVFSQARPASAPGSSFLATMITADSLDQAKRVVDQGFASDGTFPNEVAVLAKSSDVWRNIRYTAFDNAILNVKVRALSSILRTNTDNLVTTNVLGYQTGLANFTVPAGAFAPGAIADSLTSYGGVIFGPNSQTSLLAMINAGAAGSYGTVAEPGTDAQKFPDPQVYFYQSRGFSLAESYYQSVNAPYLGLVVAEPLAAPFAQPGVGKWIGSNTVLTGMAPLSVRFDAADSLAFGRVDLFVDGKFHQTLTNLAPSAGNVLNLALNGFPLSYVVPTNASLGSVATGLAAALNAPAVSNYTKILAFPHGDRVELQSVATNLSVAPFYFEHTAGNTNNWAYQVAYLPDTFPPQLTQAGLDRNGAFQLHVDIASTLPYVIQASSNLVHWAPVFTNFAGGLMDFIEPDATNYVRRFYRVAESVPDPHPSLSLSPTTNGNGFLLHIETAASQPYAVQVSTNFDSWTSLYTNQLGGPMDFVDLTTSAEVSRFYRTWNIPQPPPTFAVLNSPAGNPLVRVDNPSRPFLIAASTNQPQWVGLVTNYVLGKVQTTAGSSIGSADTLTTSLQAGASTFRDSEAFGRQQYIVVASPAIISVGAYLQLTVTKTNGTVVIVGLTNRIAGISSSDFANQFYSLINATAALQGPDGLVAEDFNVAAATYFNLRARTAGWAAAGIRVAPQKSGVGMFPSSAGTLTQNISDLRPRNHLYVGAGLHSLGFSFTLDTTTLPDGYHELTAVAYEGTHVGTQTKATRPALVQNTSLGATMTLLDLPLTAPVQGSYHIQVTANTNAISQVALWSTGGALATVTNQSTAVFQVEGSSLGAGRHPFYALVRDTDGRSYRTETKWVRLVRGQ